MNLPPWFRIARRHIGTTEFPGKSTHPTILRWLVLLRAWWRDDETPWCGAFVGAALHEAGVEVPKRWFRARSWLDWGEPLAAPCRGAVVVFERGGAGHVGFVAGVDGEGRIMTLGGNQRNGVNVAPFDPQRVLGYRWPKGVARPVEPPPLMASSAASSGGEA